MDPQFLRTPSCAPKRQVFRSARKIREQKMGLAPSVPFFFYAPSIASVEQIAEFYPSKYVRIGNFFPPFYILTVPSCE